MAEQPGLSILRAGMGLRPALRPRPGRDRWFGGGRLNASQTAWTATRPRGEQDRLLLGGRRPRGDRRSATASSTGGHRLAAPARAGVKKGDRVVLYLPMIRSWPWPCWPAPAGGGAQRGLRGFSARAWRAHQRLRGQVVLTADGGFRAGKTVPSRPRWTRPWPTAPGGAGAGLPPHRPGRRLGPGMSGGKRRWGRCRRAPWCRPSPWSRGPLFISTLWLHRKPKGVVHTTGGTCSTPP